MGRGAKTTPLRNEPEYFRAILTSRLWEMSGTLGYIGLGVVLFVCLLVLGLNNAGIRRAIRDSVPEPLAHFFEEPAASTPLEPPLLRKAGKAIREAAPQSAAAASFTVGSTRDDVRKAQGEPTESTDAVWSYGRSQVYFVNGRVSGWNEASENPLRFRRQPL